MEPRSWASNDLMDVAAEIALAVIGLFVVVVFFGLRLTWKVAENIATDEVRGRLAKATRGLVYEAVERLPESARGRYAEEWQGELSQVLDRPLTAFIWAVGIRRSARSLAQELACEVEPVATGGRGRRRRALVVVAAVAQVPVKVVKRLPTVPDRIRVLDEIFAGAAIGAAGGGLFGVANLISLSFMGITAAVGAGSVLGAAIGFAFAYHRVTRRTRYRR
jgi:uncharacterized membrane protein (Fun14 family)